MPRSVCSCSKVFSKVLARRLVPVGKGQTNQDMDTSESKETEKFNKRQKVAGTWQAGKEAESSGIRRQREGRSQGQGRQVDQDQVQQLTKATASGSLATRPTGLWVY